MDTAKDINIVTPSQKQQKTMKLEIDSDDIQSILNMLEGNTDREKIINFINKYVWVKKPTKQKTLTVEQLEELAKINNELGF